MSRRDPIQIERLKTIATAFVALILLSIATLFAVRVPRALSNSSLSADKKATLLPAESSNVEVKPLDRTGFDRAVLFRGETQSIAKISTPTGPVASLGPLSLVAIVNGEGGVKRAALFGAASNELVLLAKEEKHGSVRVLDIDDRGVDLEQEGNRVRLSLVDGPRGSSSEVRK